MTRYDEHQTEEQSPSNPIILTGGIGLYRAYKRSFRQVHAALLPADETLTRRRPLYYVAFGMLASSLLLRQPLLFVAGLLVFAVAAVPEIWYRYGLRDVDVQRRLGVTRAVFGDDVDVQLVVENRKRLPLPWLEVEDEFPDALPVRDILLRPSHAPESAMLTNTLTLWSWQRVRRRFRIRAVARGAYRFGPMAVRTSDPFGITTREMMIPASATLLVHPLVAPIGKLGLPPETPFGERKAPRRLLEDPLRVVGTRDYAPGDDLRRIHWKATAHIGSLQSKVYEPSARHTLAIFLDVRTLTTAFQGYDPALAELAISTAASVATWAVERGYAVGIYSNGALSLPALIDERRSDDHLSSRADTAEPDTEAVHVAREVARLASGMRLGLAPSARGEQLERILDSLARLLPYYSMPLERVIASEEQRLPPRTTVVYIGAEAHVDVPLILALRRMRSHGHAPWLLLTKAPDSAGAERRPLFLAQLPTYHIGGRELWAELMRDVLGDEPTRPASSIAASITPLGDGPLHSKIPEARQIRQAPASALSAASRDSHAVIGTSYAADSDDGGADAAAIQQPERGRARSLLVE